MLRTCEVRASIILNILKNQGLESFICSFLSCYFLKFHFDATFKIEIIKKRLNANLTYGKRI
jgi:hypothetical protein